MSTKHTPAHWTDELVEMAACSEAVRWARTQPSFAVAWRTCERGDWMLWLAVQMGVRRELVWVACQVARTALKYVPTGEDRPRIAIETAEAWARGEATTGEVRAAAAAASYAADAAALKESAAIVRREWPSLKRLRDAARAEGDR